jgi:lysophospholipase L1-like esterase
LIFVTYQESNNYFSIMKHFLFFCYIVTFTFLGLELFLRVYNPLDLRVKGNKIILPKNKKYNILVEDNPTFTGSITHTKNNLGFRGPNINSEFSKSLSVISVGGSTTECFFLSDGLTWVDKMDTILSKAIHPIWINNAGLNGHSTFGHQILLEDHIVKIKPKVVLFLIGINDLGQGRITSFDKLMLKDQAVTMNDSWWKDFGRSIIKNSEAFQTVYAIFSGIKTQQKNFRDDKRLVLSKTDTLSLSKLEIEQELISIRPLLSDFRKRVENLVTICRKSDIEPILITQPLLFGNAIDPISGIDLSKHKIASHKNGLLYWKKLELYNDIVRSVSSKNRIHLIDLGHIMPKSSSLFYDEMHFTKEGANVVGEIIGNDLKSYFPMKYPHYSLLK